MRYSGEAPTADMNSLINWAIIQAAHLVAMVKENWPDLLNQAEGARQLAM